jgi:hypothetical protein
LWNSIIYSFIYLILLLVVRSYAFGEEASAGIQEDICLTLQKLKRAAVKFGALRSP